MRSGYSFKNLSTDCPQGGYAARAASVTLVSRRNMPLSLSTGRTRRFDKLRVIAVEARMSTTVAVTGTYTVQWLIESRPPGVSWSRPSPAQPNQPPLDFTDHESGHVEAALPNDRGVRVSMVKARWAARATARSTGCSGVEHRACAGCDPNTAGPAAGLSSQWFKTCPSGYW
jgi:hypothetical protein